MKKFSALLFFAFAFFLAGNHSLQACAACYGDTTGSRMGNAAQIGILSMLALMLVVLATLGGFFLYLAYRSKHPLDDYHDLLNEQEGSSPTS